MADRRADKMVVPSIGLGQRVTTGITQCHGPDRPGVATALSLLWENNKKIERENLRIYLSWITNNASF